jgi:hypothetical protein
VELTILLAAAAELLAPALDTLGLAEALAEAAVEASTAAELERLTLEAAAAADRVPVELIPHLAVLAVQVL